MNIDQLHETLDNKHIDSDLKREKLVVFLNEYIVSVENNPEKRKSLAYDIASILATDYARFLNVDDTIDNILTLAGELEIDYEAKAWETLSSMIKSL